MLDRNNLPEELTRQQAFDHVVEHLFMQGKPSISANFKCRYRGPDDLMCAVGCLVPDKDYTPEMESITINTLVSSFPAEVDLRLIKIVRLLQALQGAHDNVDNWDNDLYPLKRR